MRSRYVISAAVLVAAACIGRRREAPAAPHAGPTRVPEDALVPQPAPPAPVAAVEEPVVAPPATVEEPVAVVEEPAPVEPVVAVEAIAEEPVAVEEPVVAESGSFALGGRALAPGHAVLSGITFAARHDGPIPAELLRLRVERALNVPDGGLVVLSDAGFAPDAHGFTIALAAASAGRFAASGTYEVLADPTFDPDTAPTGGSSR
ncbi:MAG: hypothetical protein QOD86_1265 [Miltoncostaeaceae bacterium]|nr:hypothetical protein [Miltoncostaeaceae bacterium]